MNLKPFIKYVGGKSKLLPTLLTHFPSYIDNYYEPFVGGGSVLFDLLDKNLIHGEIYISDINVHLINLYLTIKNNLQLLFLELEKPIYTNTSEQYYINRTRYNNIKDSDNIIETSALFIYLNKCGYNGMYRENSKGGFNVPFGKQKNPTILNKPLLTTVSHHLQKCHIQHMNYTDLDVKPSSLVYIDPPYDNTFTSYTKHTFGKNEQTELKHFIDTLSLGNIKVVASNSATDFIQDLYQNYTVNVTNTTYNVNSKSSERKILKQEVIVKNF